MARITEQPKRLVRIIRAVLSVLLILASFFVPAGRLWALVPAAGTVGLFVVRTAPEDRMLRHKLPGYDAYAARKGTKH
jgi:protein-S-isoprenylcysteine O-methyltransferase Ste14